ncbi:MAG: AAA family ATPase [Gemmatimonadota bacterium]|nr:AAA family ATPase [Gemmatimonadota bacterium]MDE2871971.1 AAA family ATPase [Gemmatimonadota bacterium]
MIRRIQALNYRCLRHLDVSLDRFHLLVGPAGTGKSTVLDALAFLGDLVRDGPEAAVSCRTDDFRDLVWGRPREDQGFELAIEFAIPEACRALLPEDKDYGIYRYEVVVRSDERGPGIHVERGILAPAPKSAPVQASLFPEMPAPPPTVLAPGRPGTSTVLSKTPAGNDWFYRETDAGKGWDIRISLGRRRSTLGNLPEAPETMPVATAFKRVLERGVRLLRLDGATLSRPCPPRSAGIDLEPGGGNLPRVVKRLREEHRGSFDSWLERVRGAVPGLRDIEVAERAEDRFAYLVLRYEDGLAVPSRLESEGVLRLMSLSLLPCLPAEGRIHMVEEPENGVHPVWLNAVWDSLAAMRGSQLLVTTCSEALVARAEPGRLICLARGAEGVVGVVKGSEHPLLAEREGQLDPGVLVGGGDRSMP